MPKPHLPGNLCKLTQPRKQTNGMATMSTYKIVVDRISWDYVSRPSSDLESSKLQQHTGEAHKPSCKWRNDTTPLQPLPFHQKRSQCSLLCFRQGGCPVSLQFLSHRANLVVDRKDEHNLIPTCLGDDEACSSVELPFGCIDWVWML